MADDPTLRFYADNAASYARHATDPTGEPLGAFVGLVPAGGRILELGCGNGRDAAHMLSLGYDVEATDGTLELAAEAERRLGRPVRVLRFEDLDAVAAFDGIWACASLLHAPAPDLVGILQRIRRALRPGGVFVASFKGGSGEGRDSLGRYYNYPTAESLLGDYRKAGWVDLALEARLGGGYDGQPTQWLWVTARLPAP